MAVETAEQDLYCVSTVLVTCNLAKGILLVIQRASSLLPNARSIPDSA